MGESSFEAMIDEVFGGRFLKEYKGKADIMWKREDVIENGVVEKTKIQLDVIGMNEMTRCQIQRIVKGIHVESYHLSPIVEDKKDMFCLTIIVCKNAPSPSTPKPVTIVSNELCENIKLRSVDRGTIKKIPDEVRNQMLVVASLLDSLSYKDVVVGSTYILYKGIDEFVWCSQISLDCDILFSMEDLSLEDKDEDTGKINIRVEKVFSVKITFPVPTAKKRGLFSYLTGN